MEKAEFEEQFDARLAAPLAAFGFQPVNRSIHAIIDDTEIALIRLGGRMSTAGAISYVLCVRKRWLRTRDEVVPDGFVGEVFDHPYKFVPWKLDGKRSLRYTPQNLHYDRDSMAFADATTAEIDADLEDLRSTIVDLVIPWAAKLTAKSLLKELRRRGERAWIERLWMEDCLARLR